MNKKTVTLIVSAALVGSALTLNQDPPTRGQTATTRPPVSATGGTKKSPSPSQAPEHVVYRQFFRHLTALKKRATEMEIQGKNGKALRSHYKDKIGLKDNQARQLDEIADECERDVAKVDAKAQKIINALRDSYPNGVLPEGENLPPAPPELKKLQLRRDMIVMRARHRLVTELGAQGFQQIDDYIKVKFARDVQPTALRRRQARSAQQRPPTGGDK